MTDDWDAFPAWIYPRGFRGRRGRAICERVWGLPPVSWWLRRFERRDEAS